MIFTAIPELVLIAGRCKSLLSGDRYLPLNDGLYIWSGARLALAGQFTTIFIPQNYAKWFAVHFGGDLHVWGYPPSYLLVILPFGLLAPAPAVFCFDIISCLCLTLALRVSGFGWKLTAAILLCPAALMSLSGGQNGAIMASLLISGLLLAETRPWLAGLLLGLVTIKPQLGLLVPIYLLGRGDLRSITGALATALVLAVASAWAFTLHSWVLFITKLAPFMGYLLAQLTGPLHLGPRAMIMSSFSLARQAGLGVTTAYLLQTATTFGALVAAWKIGRAQTMPPQDRLIRVLLLAVLASPYIWNYDMIPASLATALLIRSGMTTDFLPGELLVLAGLWVTPGLAYYAALAGYPTFAPLLVILALSYARRHARANP